VYNGPLPPPPQHQPCLSFDDDGRYIGTTDDLVAGVCKEKILPSKEPVESKVGSVVSAKPLPGKPDTSDGQMSVTSTETSGAAVDVAKKPFVQTIQRPFTEVS